MNSRIPFTAAALFRGKFTVFNQAVHKLQITISRSPDHDNNRKCNNCKNISSCNKALSYDDLLHKRVLKCHLINGTMRTEQYKSPQMALKYCLKSRQYEDVIQCKCIGCILLNKTIVLC